MMKKINLMLLRSGIREATALLGAESIILTLVDNLNKEKFNPALIYLGNKNQKIIPIVKGAQGKNINVTVINLKNPFDITSIFKIRNFLKLHKTDILHCNEYKSNIIGFLASRFMKIKIITTIHGWTGANLKVKFYELLDLLIIRFFDKIIAVSNSMKKELLNRKIPQEKITVIYNAIDLNSFSEIFSKSNLRNSLGIKDDVKVIGTIGRLSTEKGHKYFLRAAKEIIKIFPETVFLIIGDGHLRKRIEFYIRELGITKNVKLLGFQKNTKELLCLMDIYVSSSLRESFGLSLVEAMALGKPVVATSVGIAPEVVLNNETGILVPPKSSKALVNGITNLLKDKELCNKFRESAKRIIEEKISLNSMINNYEKTYLDLFKGER